jgi:osmotically-inducible protein OsmY
VQIMFAIAASEARLSSTVDLRPGFGLEPSDEPERRDEEIQYAVTTALLWDLAVPRDRVSVRVKRGWVTLSGKVGRAYEKSCAEADARSTPGVLGVTNQIDCGQAT